MYNYIMDIRLRDVDPKLHRDFKLLCVMNGTSIQRQIYALMIQFVAKNAHKLPPENAK